MTDDLSGKSPTGPGDDGWQAQKSAGTRQQIIDATIECLVEHGYQNTTTIRIVEMAGVSRGAALHHFPSRLDMIASALSYLHQRRLDAFSKSIRQVPAGADNVDVAVDSYWAMVTDPSFVAIFELSVASRTDPKLRRILRPGQLEFDREWYRTACDLFPEWQADQEAFYLALNLTQQLMEGMAISYLTHARKDDKQILLDYLAEKLRELKPNSGGRSGKKKKS